MKYTDSEVSPAFQQYFGKRYDKWKTTLDGILDEKRLSDEEVTDQNQKKFKSSITFSWLGLLFNIPLFTDRPPFGGNKNEYVSYFQSYFKIHHMAPCYNSYSKRNGKELFMKLIKE